MSALRPLGRRPSENDEHIRLFPFSNVIDRTITTVERHLVLPAWHWSHDQWSEGSCVGHGIVMERAVTNKRQFAQNKILGYRTRYDPIYIWNEAKAIDEWDDTNPGDDNGTSVRAGYQVVHKVGMVPVRTMKIVDHKVVAVAPQNPDMSAGVLAYRWARTVDEIRTAVAMGNAVAIGVNWYSNFDAPVKKTNGEYWIGEGDLGRVRGGHSLTIYGASDRRRPLNEELGVNSIH